MPRKRSLESVLMDSAGDIALVIGNGINRYGVSGISSWDQLLVQIARNCSVNVPNVPKGTALTEFYDVLELTTSRRRTGESNPEAKLNLQAEFCRLMDNWQPAPHHRAIMGWAERHAVPVLTTNFEEVLSEAADCRFLKPRNRAFTDFYPWECRFGHVLYDNPCDGFGIWHINGMRRYKRSIRLGLSHYMGSVQRARSWLHHSEARLFSAKNRSDWAGANTWMHLLFNKPLLIFGIGLEENEVFLRWLLIERARYFRDFPSRHRPAWFVYTPNPKDDREAGRHFFLEGIGISCVEAADYDDIYANSGWVK